ncbi:alcohol dehydrogenase [Verticillium dahliae]
MCARDDSWTNKANMLRIMHGLANAASRVTNSIPELFTRDSLFTKAPLNNRGKTPTAIDFEVLKSEAIYKTDPRWIKDNKGTLQRLRARWEFTASGDTFDSPQILNHSGIGPAVKLRQLGIRIIKDLPGVGENMLENSDAGVSDLPTMISTATFSIIKALTYLDDYRNN